MKHATFAGVVVPYTAAQRSTRVVRQRRVVDVRLTHRGQGPKEHIDDYRPEPELVEALKGLRAQPLPLTFDDSSETLYYLGSSASHAYAPEEGYTFELSHRFSSFDPAADSDRTADLRDLAVSRFRDLLDRAGTTEDELRAFLTENAFLLYHFFPVKGCLMHGDIYAGVPLGDDRRADFVGHWCNAVGDNYVLIDFEKASQPLFGEGGTPEAALTRAIEKVESWHAWLEANPSLAKESLPGAKRIRSLVFIGRRQDLDADGKERLRQMNDDLSGRPYLSTYDAILESNDAPAGGGFGVEFLILPGAAVRCLRPASGTHPNYGPGHPLAG